MPRLELDLSLVDIGKTDFEDYTKLSPKPFESDDPDGYLGGVPLKDISEWSDRSWAKVADAYEAVPSNWKETHLQSPFAYNGGDPIDSGMNSYWNVATNNADVSAIPYSFFEGGSWLVDQDANVTRRPRWSHRFEKCYNQQRVGTWIRLVRIS